MDGGASTEVEAKVSEEEQVRIISSNPVDKLPLLTPEELVAKAIAPVKKEYLCPPPVRPCPPIPNEVNKSANEGGEVLEKTSGYSNVAKEKKSKRQLKRERHQEQKSALHICPMVAKIGNASACRYGNDCRFSHDIEVFKAEKPADLEGTCPFLSLEGPCPYGLACRYLGTHKEDVSADSSSMHKRSEMNGLSKDVQKLLWKNKMTFPKADAQLKFLGLMDKSKKVEVKEEEDALTIMNGSPTACVNDGGEVSTGSVICKPDCSQEVPLQEVSVHNAVPVDGSRPVKKAKHPTDEKCSGELDNGVDPLENGLEKICTLTEVETTQTDNSISETDMCLKLHPREKKLIDFRGKLYLAPLTTVGNLPFRRVCKVLGADITCGEMAMCTNLLQGQASEWALLRRHSDEDLFGVQICGAFPDTVARTVELIDRECTVDFIDINMGCPIDAVVNKGAGSCLLTKPMRMKNIIKAASSIVDKPITVKVRTAYFEGRNRIDSLIADMGDWGASAVTIHGRSRQQRYSKLADWDYIYQCAKKAPDSLQVLGNGDVCSYVDWNKHLADSPKLSACMIARGSLVKPWIFTEIKEQRHWDISSGERLDILRDYVRFGLEHWGSDTKGVETTRHFMLEWLSYTFRYVPVGLLDVIPQQLNWRPPSYYCRDDLETLMASESAADWIRISELLLGKVPAGFSFQPKHKSNAYDKAENG